MGKLLQKLVHGMVPSWLSKVKSSASTSPRKSLPFFKGGGGSPLPSTAQKNSTDTDATPPDDRSTQSNGSGCASLSPSLMSTQKPIDTAELQSDILSNAPQQTSQVDRHSDQKIRGTERDALSPSSPNHFAQSNQHVDEGNSDLDAQPYITETEDLRRSRIPLYRQSRQEDGVSELASEYHVHVSEDEILQLKRKQEAPKGEPAQDLHEDSDEEVDTALNKGRPSGNDKKRWIWKKRKGDNGLVCYDLPQSISSIVGNGRAVVKQSLDPQHALWESMVEMIVGNGLWELGNLEFLLYCYLSLNEPHLHPIIQSSFLQALRDLERIT